MASNKQTNPNISIIPAAWIMFFVIACMFDRTGVVITIFAIIGVVFCIISTISYLERGSLYGNDKDAKD